MPKFINKLADRTFEWGIKGNEVSQIDGIVLIDGRQRGGTFQTTIENALRLIQRHDPRRYARVVRYISRIVNVILPAGYHVRYDFNTRTVKLEFMEFQKFTDDKRAAIYACILIDQATDGALRSKGIVRDSKNRMRVKRIGFAEHNRFAARLVAADPVRYPSKLLELKFNENRSRKKSTNYFRLVFSAAWKAITERKIKK